MAGTDGDLEPGAVESPDCLHGGRDDADCELVERCRAGSEPAFALIVQRYEQLLVRHCARIVGHSAAEDAVQDTFLSAWNALRDGAPVQALRPWLFAIAHRKALSTLRGQRIPSRALKETLIRGRSPSEEASQSSLARDTLAALAGLPKAQREALVGSAVHGRSGKQIAGQLGIREGAVRQLIFRARAAVRVAVPPCLLPPWPLLRLFRRITSSPNRLALLARSACQSDQLELTGRFAKFGAMAILGMTVVGTGALHLGSTPHRRAQPPSTSAGPARPGVREEARSGVLAVARVGRSSTSHPAAARHHAQGIRLGRAAAKRPSQSPAASRTSATAISTARSSPPAAASPQDRPAEPSRPAPVPGTPGAQTAVAAAASSAATPPVKRPPDPAPPSPASPGGAVTAALAPAVETVTTPVQALASPVVSAATGAAGSVATTAQTAVAAVVRTASTVARTTVPALAPAVQSVTAPVAAAATQALGAVSTVAQTAAPAQAQPAATPASTVTQATNKALAGLVGALP